MTPKKILIIGFIIAIAELIIGVIYLKYSSSTPSTPALKPSTVKTAPLLPQPTPPQTQGPTLKLTATSSTLKIGDLVSISANASLPNQKSRAADLTIKYDPVFLSPVNVKTPFEKGNIYQKLVYNITDNKSGIASMSAVSALDSPFSGAGILSTIAFKTLKTGSTEVSIAFTKGDSRDTNLVVDGKDALVSVSNLSLQITP